LRSDLVDGPEDGADQASADLVGDVVRELDALDAVVRAEEAGRVRREDEGVVQEAVAPLRLARAVAADADRVRLGGLLHEDVADDLRVLAREVDGRLARADQLELVVAGALDPVVVNL